MSMVNLSICAPRGMGKIRAFELLVVRIVKLLIHARRRDLAINLHGDVVVANFQRRVGPGRMASGAGGGARVANGLH